MNRMSSYPPPPMPPEAPEHFPPLPPEFARPKTWYQRNWKWVVPVAIIGMLAIFFGFFAALFFGITTMMKSSGAYTIAVQRALDSPAVQARLGTPIRVGRFTSGSVNLNGGSGNASLSIPLHGPRGDARIAVVAKERANRWTFDTLEVDVDGDHKPIPLLSDGPAPSPRAIPSDSPGAPAGTT
jgi:hypothetical protein